MSSVGSVSTRYHSLDILRAISIIWIILYHYPRRNFETFFGPWVESGVLAIDLFFVLSGYLISFQIYASFKDAGEALLRKFYIKRIMKTWPNYFAVLFLLFLFPYLKGKAYFPPWINALTFTQNFDLEPGVFSVSWSICVEEHFYLLFPLLAIPLLKVNKPKWLLPFFFGILFAGILIRYSIWQTYFTDSNPEDILYKKHIYYPTWTRLDGIVVGCILGYFHFFHRTLWEKLSGGWSWVFLALSVLFIGYSLELERDKYSELAITVRFLTTSIGFGFLCLFGLLKERVFDTRKIPLVEYISIISYALYLTHRHVIHATGAVLAELKIRYHSVPGLLLITVMIFICAYIIFNLVEKPFMGVRNRWLRKI